MLAEAMLNLMRRYAASPALVFRAFAEPQLLERWLCPDPSASLRVEHLDFRVGGTYRLVFTFPDAVRPVIGEYLVIDPPNLLRFTWAWEPPDEFAGLETVVTVSVRAAADGCELELTHERFPNGKLKDQHASGWNGALARLETFLKGAIAHGND